MEQIIFDTTLGRTVQSRSCNMCYQRKSKCTRHTPCQACVASGTECSYSSRPRPRDRNAQPASGKRRAAPARRRPSKPPQQTTSGVNLNSADPYGDTDWLGESTTPAKSQELLPVGTESISNLWAPWSGNARDVFTSTFPGLTDELTDELEPIFADWSNLEIPDAGSLGLMDVGETVSPSYLTTPIEAMNSPYHGADPGLAQARRASTTLPRTPSGGNHDFLLRYINIFLDKLHPVMPFFKQSYLTDNIAARRYEHDQAFSALVHAICALALLQPVQTADAVVVRERAQMAEQLLQESVRQHSSVRLGEKPLLENVLTSVFLFACLFCQNNHNAARFRLQEANSLMDMIGIESGGQTYERVAADEKDRRLRTLLCLTIINRIYAIQRDYSPNGLRLSSRRILSIQNLVKQGHGGDQRELETVVALGHMVDLIGFIDDRVVRCWKGECWADPDNDEHVSRQTVCSLLKRYSMPITLHDHGNDARHADFLVTRHWIRHILWSLGRSHGFMDDADAERTMRMSYAVCIAEDTIGTCEQFDIACLEVHGIGLVEKLNDIVMSALEVVKMEKISHEAGQDSKNMAIALTQVKPGVVLDVTAADCIPGGLTARHKNGLMVVGSTRDSDFANRFLALFARFRGGRHRFLNPYMRVLCELNIT